MTRRGHDRGTRRSPSGYPVPMVTCCYLGHGASGNATSMAPFVEGLVARGVPAAAIDLPRRRAEDALDPFHLAVPSMDGTAIGGHSYGGRVASSRRPSPTPGTSGSSCSATRSTPQAPRIERRPGPHTGRRSAVGPAPVRCLRPVRQGRPAPGGRPRPVDRGARDLPRLGHTLRPVLDDALDRAAAFLLSLPG